MMPLLAVSGLTADMPVGGDLVRIVEGLDFGICVGERVALVGESGSGKSVTERALMRLDRKARLSGRVDLDGSDLLSLNERRMIALRGAAVGMVFQDPMSSLDPLMTIGDQVAESLRIRGVSARDARARALAVLDELRVERARERLGAYTYEFSGGMRQRVVLAGTPRLLIADEPTTALDVRVQEQVLDLLDEVSAARGLSVLLIMHDLGIVYQMRPCGEGVVDFDAALPILAAANPELDLTIENDESLGDRPRPRNRVVQIYEPEFLKGHPDLTVEEFAAYMELVRAYEARIVSGECPDRDAWAARPFGYAETVDYIQRSAAHIRGVCKVHGLAPGRGACALGDVPSAFSFSGDAGEGKERRRPHRAAPFHVGT